MGKKAKSSSLQLRRATCVCVAYVIISACFVIRCTPYEETAKQTETKHKVFDLHTTTTNSNSPLILRWLKDFLVNTDVEGSKCDIKRHLNFNLNICKLALQKYNESTSKMSFLTKASEKATKLDNIKLERVVDNSCNLEQISHNCKAVIDSYVYGKYNITNEEKAFPLAFAIKIHSNANQAHRLLRFIYRRHNIYCVHVDKKAKESLFEHFKSIARCFDNIIVIEDRVDVVYSTIRQVEAEFKCIDAVRKAKQKWKYYINLTGQEFMLKTNLEIVKILKKLNGSNDIESYPMENESYKLKSKTIIVGSHSVTTKIQKPPFHRNITVRKGCAYGLFSRRFIEFVRTDSVAQEFIHWLDETYAPEEMVWATLNALPAAPGGYKGDITLTKHRTFISRMVIWAMDDHLKCEGKFVRWICIYGLGDINGLLKSRNVVANKFYEDFEPMALDCLEKEMYTRMTSSSGVSDTFDMSAYGDLPHLRKHNSP